MIGNKTLDIFGIETAKIVDVFYEEVKHMIDILEIAREDGEQKGMEKGMEIGMEKGTLKAVQEMLMEVLATKLGVIPYRIVNEIKSINTVETLKTLLKIMTVCQVESR
ncbi:MAG: hypothetical protein OMM_11546 [Candidatus Magnetoglobus multicellularis str. Araruama]|uniref:Uncharacterized protein n=1 Tax=Candidatus Magnetoglobus multicellularis str. Araruama TaxID=890399 RepID=A0A1V1NY58_9BACT|nr:MAG: hypothetical protein OMM_11546 [Candidatus Magnetoglobus multicellularis str. Araruama]